MRISSFVSSVYHSLHSGLGRLSGFWRGHKVRSLPAHNTLPTSQPFSAKTLAQWQVTARGEGEELLQLRHKRLRQRELDQFVESLELHYSDFYEDKDQLHSKVAFVLTQLGMASGTVNSLKPSGFFASKLNNSKLFLLDRYLACPDPVEFGRIWLNDGGSLDENFVLHCVYPARVEQAPLFTNHELSQMGFIRRDDDNRYTLVSMDITLDHLERIEKTRRSRPVQALVSEQKGLMTLQKLEHFCQSLSQWVDEPVKSQLLEPLDENNLSGLVELTRQPGIQYFQGLDQSIQGFMDALPARQTLEQQLQTVATSSPIQPALIDCLVAFKSAALDENTDRILTGMLSDIQQQQLSSERLNHYIIRLLIQAPEPIRMLSQMFSLVAQHLTNDQPIHGIQNTPWQQTFHQDMTFIVKRVERFNDSGRDLRKFCIADIPSILAKIASETDMFSYDKGLSHLFALIEEIHDACLIPSVSSDTRKMIRSSAETWLSQITAELTKRLPVALKYGLNGDAPVSPEFLGIKQHMSNEWQAILNSINGSDEMLTQFEKDRSRTDFQFKVAPGSKKKRKDQSYSHVSNILESPHLMRFLGNRSAAMTLSKLLTQTFAAYQTKLETYRLHQVTPFLLTPMGRDAGDDTQVIVTQQADGNLTVDYLMTASKPPYSLGAQGAGVMGLKTYQICGRSTVSMDRLKQGIVEATEPEVTVKLDTRNGQIDWYVDGDGQPLQIPCPY
ncbi:hypothetical protein [Endozoicomonas sp. 4G]|uniref:hypothetical protein n=1 Tax=Endozoicomonas sp. 4G TaxID=2872754 RepID=UPI00207873FB|nr:hypothetical protein [Endozoicomonas sp. 4G]